MPRPRSTVNPLDAIEADASSRSFLPSSRPDPRQRSSPRAPTNRLRLIRRSTTSSTLLPPPLHPPSSRPAVCTPANLCTWADRRPESLATRLFLPGHRWRRGTVGKHRALGNEEDSGDDESWFPNASWTRAFAGGPWLAALLRPPYPRSHSTPRVSARVQGERRLGIRNELDREEAISRVDFAEGRRKILKKQRKGHWIKRKLAEHKRVQSQ